MQRSVIVVGGGTMGLASAWALARAGAAVTVLERFAHHHERGSHSGYTRVIRQAYHEGESYVPLVQEADRAWVELGARSGRELLVRTGMLELGPELDPELQRSVAACVKHGVAHVRHDARELRRRWPFVVPDDWCGYFTPSGGYLRVGPCFDALRDEAQEAGASFRYGVKVRAIERGARARVVIDGEAPLEADAIVVTAGAWLPELMPELLPGRLHPLRRVLTWWKPAPARIAALSRLPVWAAFDPEGYFYGFPYGDEGITGLKLACHNTPKPTSSDRPIDPDHLDRELHPADLAPLQAFVRERLPGADGELVGHRVCIYTTTPSWSFVIDRHPEDERIVFAGGFSGHGFKFAPAIGRMLAELALDPTIASLPQFALSRHRSG
jgi:monomeric sarcosine oxidase